MSKVLIPERIKIQYELNTEEISLIRSLSKFSWIAESNWVICLNFYQAWVDFLNNYRGNSSAEGHVATIEFQNAFLQKTEAVEKLIAEANLPKDRIECGVNHTVMDRSISCMAARPIVANLRGIIPMAMIKILKIKSAYLADQEYHRAR